MQGRGLRLRRPLRTALHDRLEHALGRMVAEKVNASRGPVSVLIPRRGISVISAAGGPFHDQHADAALFQAIESGLRPGVPCLSLDCEINDPAFARACVDALIATMERCSRSHPRSPRGTPACRP